MSGVRRIERLGPISSFVAILLIYIVLISLLPASKVAMASYHLTTATYHVLLIVVELPLTVTWLAAFYGYSKLRQYTESITETPEATGFRHVTTGLRWLAWSLVAPMIVSLIANSIANDHPGFHATAIILSNYLNLLFPLIAFTFLANGADRLLEQGKGIRNATRHYKALLLLFACLSGMYCFLTFRYVSISHPSSSDNVFFLPSWLLLITLIIPYIYTWFVGLAAAYAINTTAKYAKGVLYRQGLTLIAGGISLIVASSVGSQYLHTIVPRSGHLALNLVLLIVYLFYIVIILGFVLVSLGANRLKKIEDI